MKSQKVSSLEKKNQLKFHLEKLEDYE